LVREEKMLTIKELIEQLSQYSGECPFYILDHHGARYNIEVIQPAPALNPEAPIVEDTAKALCVEIAIRPSTDEELSEFGYQAGVYAGRGIKILTLDELVRLHKPDSDTKQ
jgi:hypothetical protein